MESSFKKELNGFKVNQVVMLKLKNGKTAHYCIFAIADDEFVLLHSNVTFRKFPGKELLINLALLLNGTKVGIGDQVQMINDEGVIAKMYVSYIFDHDCITLSNREVPTKNSLKWLLKLMSDF